MVDYSNREKAVMATDKVIISLIPGGIVKVFVKDNTYLTVDDLDKNLEILKSINPGLKMPFMVVFSYNVSASDDAYQALHSIERTRIKSIEAIVLNSSFQRVIVDLNIKIYQPKHPTKTFSDEHKALKWIRQNTFNLN